MKRNFGGKTYQFINNNITDRKIHKFRIIDTISRIQRYKVVVGKIQI